MTEPEPISNYWRVSLDVPNPASKGPRNPPVSFILNLNVEATSMEKALAKIREEYPTAVIWKCNFLEKCHFKA